MGIEKYNRFEPFKALVHSEKINTILRGAIPSPVHWTIYPSNVCGYKCGHCIMAKTQIDHRDQLSEAAMDKIPGDAKRLGIKCVLFSGGGDPLLNRFTLRTARKLKENGVYVGLDNQGFLLNDASPFGFIRFSIDAATRETYLKIHGVDGWDRVNANIRKLADLRASGEKIDMGFAFLITPHNHHEVYAFCEWSKQYSPDYIYIRPAYLDADYMQHAYPGGGARVKDEIMPAVLETLKRIKKDFPNSVCGTNKFDGFWTPKLYNKCLATPLMAVTSGDGAFIICKDRGTRAEENYLRWGDYNTEPFDKIWWSEEHKKAIESIDLKNCPRCVMNSYNEIIEHCFIDDKLKVSLI